jgi:HlyD family secretion protein
MILRKKYPFILFLAVSFCLTAVSRSFAEDKKDSFKVPVFATPAKRGDIKETLKVTGTVYSMNSVSISPKATGQVIKVYHDEGERVNKGDALLKIDDDKIKLRLKQAEAGEKAASEIHLKTQTALKLEEEQTELQINLATSNLDAAKALYDKAKTGAREEEKKQAEASMLSAEAALKNAEANFKRMEELYNKKTVSKQQYELENMQYDVAKAQYEIAKENNNLVQAGLREEDIKAAEANFKSATTALKIAQSLKLTLELIRNDLNAALSNLKSAQYEKKIAKIMLDDTLVRAPISGTISKKFIEEGEMIQTPGIPVFTILDLKSVKVKVNLPETSIAKVKTGQTAGIELDSYPGKAFTGTISRLGETIDLRQRTMEVEITIANDDGLLKEGMFARVAIYTDVRKGVIYVPISAVVDDNGKKYVFTVNSSSPVKNIVETGVTEGDNVEIVSGINEGDEVIYRGNTRLDESMILDVERK